ncbi:MAG: hypothetical protein J0I29_13755 [Rhizobiales bacterium]|nr:hypothetical protein [Hyphomicrobiales bacterium]
MHRWIVAAAAATATIFLTADLAMSDQTYGVAVIRDLKTGYFQRTYKGKNFSDTGVVDVYANRSDENFGQPYIQMKKGDDAGYCGLTQSTYERYRSNFPIGTPIRLTGVMDQWYLKDHSLLLKDECEVNKPAVAPSFGMKVVADMKSAYFERTYLGKVFSDTGTVQNYLQRFITWVWYVEIAIGQERVFCQLSDANRAQLAHDFPVGNRVRITGKMAEWDLNDDTLRLDDNCQLANN